MTMKKTIPSSKTIVIVTVAAVVSASVLLATPGNSFLLTPSTVVTSPLTPTSRLSKSTTKTDTDLWFSVEDVVEQLTNTEVQSLKEELYELSAKTNRGFTANAIQRRTASDIIFDLARFNQSREPAKDYYNDGRGSGSSSSSTGADVTTTSASSRRTPSSPQPSVIMGKWQLIYTDAPDIVSLDSSKNPFSTAKLGRIGQECSPPYIKNVIEWLRPDWAKDLPFSGTDQSRILQKVVTAASATPTKPLLVNLKVAGFELEAGTTKMTGRGDSDGNGMSTTTTTTTSSSSDLMNRIQREGIPAGLLSFNPVDLKGPVNTPFGQFEILYLDDELRMIRTGQNYLAVNRRLAPDEEWF